MGINFIGKLLSFIGMIGNFGTKRWPSDKANHTCENML